MDRYLIISNHTAEDCHLALDHFREHYPGFLTHFEWGCYDNDHNAYAIIEAESREVAKMAVPPLFRDKSKVIKLTTMNPKEVEDPAHSFQM